MSLTTRLAALKEARDFRTYSLDSTEPFKLSTFLTLYTKDQRNCYMNYMEKAKILYAWLTSDGTVPLAYDVPFNLPNYSNLLGSWELSELADVIEGKKLGVKVSKDRHTVRAIVYLLTNTNRRSQQREGK